MLGDDSAAATMGKLSSTSLCLPPSSPAPNHPKPTSSTASLPLAELSVGPQLGHLAAVVVLLCEAGLLDFVWELCGGTGRSVGLDISHVQLPWPIRSSSVLDTTQGSAPTPA